MGGKSKETTTQVTNNDPWVGAQPNLTKGMTAASNLFDSGVGGQIYTGSTVAPRADRTNQGMSWLEQNAASRSGQLGAGMDNTARMAVDGLSPDQKYSMGQMRATSSGNDVFGANPQFQSILQQAQEDTRDNVNLSASSAGRYGSGGHQDVMADNIGQLTSNMLAGEYGRQLGRKDAATQQLFQAGQVGNSNELAAANSLGTQYQNTMAPGQTLIDLGSMDEDLAGRVLNDQLRIFNEQQSRPWDQVSRLLAATSGAGSYGTSSTTAQQPGRSPFATAIGGLGLLCSMF